ncbi:hypothetical protein D3C86_2030080 [compost metagenome]
MVLSLNVLLNSNVTLFAAGASSSFEHETNAKAATDNKRYFFKFCIFMILIFVLYFINRKEDYKIGGGTKISRQGSSRSDSL